MVEHANAHKTASTTPFRSAVHDPSPKSNETASPAKVACETLAAFGPAGKYHPPTACSHQLGGHRILRGARKREFASGSGWAGSLPGQHLLLQRLSPTEADSLDTAPLHEQWDTDCHLYVIYIHIHVYIYIYMYIFFGFIRRYEHVSVRICNVYIYTYICYYCLILAGRWGSTSPIARGVSSS